MRKIVFVSALWLLSLFVTNKFVWCRNSDKSNLTAAATIYLMWTAVTQDTSGNPEESPMYYNIYCDTIPAFTPGSETFVAATTVNGYTHIDPRMENSGTHFFYIIKAVDLWGNESDLSETVGDVDFVLAKVRVFLQTPYDADGDSMEALLSAKGLLPDSSPYSQAPRSVTAMPPNIADWVCIQLYDSSAGTTVAEESFLLKTDGTVAEVDGSTEELGIANAAAGDYHIMLKHRNHLIAVSDSLYSMHKGIVPFVDFTADSSCYYGSKNAKELETGVWGMWSGDLNQDLMVDTQDYWEWRSASADGESGYTLADINFDGLVTTKDYTVWYKNQSMGAEAVLP